MSDQVLLESFLKVLDDDTVFASVFMLFARVLMCLLKFCLQNCLVCNFWMKIDKMIKPLLLLLLSCPLSPVIL
jgi:hypothetical protein